MSSESSRALRVGAFITFAMALFVFIIFWIGRDRGFIRRSYPLQVKLLRVPGLMPGSLVRLGGLRVGNVTDITFSDQADDPYRYVKMKVQTRFRERIRLDSRAKLGSLGLLGDKVIDITPGSLTQPIIADNGMIPSVESIELDALLDRAAQMMDNLTLASKDVTEITKKINTGDGTLAKIINDPRLYSNLDSLLVVCTQLALAIRTNQGTLGALFNDRRLYDDLVTFSQAGTHLVNEIQNGQGSLGRLVKDPSLYNHLDSLALSLNHVSRRLQQPDSSTLGAMLSDRKFADDLSVTIKSLNELIVDIKQNPGRYIKVSVF